MARRIVLPAAALAAAMLAATAARAQEPAAATPDWVRLSDRAGWQPRDSQGEVVFDGRMWIFGGWFNSYEAPPRDVWSSADGRAWTLVEAAAPWKHSDLPMTVVHDGRMWLMGGWFNGRLPGHSASSEVWSSTDGKSWRQATAAAGWSPRLAAGLVAFKGRMWLLGGTENYYFGDARSLKHDVWSSADGVEWRCETPAAGWAPRAYHQAVVLGDYIYMLGGGNYVPEYEARADVWRSADGVHWEEVTAAAAWHPRLWFSSVAHRDRIWVLGGWSNHPARNWNDVWYSRDGRDWRRLESRVVWKERHEHSALVFDDRIVVAGGHAQPLSAEVWALALPPDWFADDR
jgi:hypothetical protein